MDDPEDYIIGGGIPLRETYRRAIDVKRSSVCRGSAFRILVPKDRQQLSRRTM